MGPSLCWGSAGTHQHQGALWPGREDRTPLCWAVLGKGLQQPSLGAVRGPELAPAPTAPPVPVLRPHVPGGLQLRQPGPMLSPPSAPRLHSRTSLQFEDEILRKLDSEVEGGRGDEQYKQLFESM